MSSCTSGSKTRKTIRFLDVYQSRTEKFFHCGYPNSTVKVILPHFLQVLDILYIVASLVQIQEMMLWSMLAIISLRAVLAYGKLIEASIT